MSSPDGGFRSACVRNPVTVGGLCMLTWHAGTGGPEEGRTGWGSRRGVTLAAALESVAQLAECHISLAKRANQEETGGESSPRHARSLSLSGRRGSAEHVLPLERTPGSRRSSQVDDVDPEISLRLPALLGLLTLLPPFIESHLAASKLRGRGEARCLACLESALQADLPLLQMAALSTD